MFIPQEQPHAQSLFLFPIVFGINFFFSQGVPRCSLPTSKLCMFRATGCQPSMAASSRMKRPTHCWQRREVLVSVNHEAYYHYYYYSLFTPIAKIMALSRVRGRGKIVITSSEKGGREKYWEVKFEESKNGDKYWFKSFDNISIIATWASDWKLVSAVSQQTALSACL